MTVEIRDERPGDEAVIERLVMAAFAGAPHAGGNEHAIVAGLRAERVLVVSLVAESDGAIVGHVAVSPVAISAGAGGWHGLGPLAVAPEHQGRGIGSRLVREALAALRGRGAAGCVLVGEPGYYARFGFASEPGLVLPGVPQRYFQAHRIRGPVPRGEVSYHAAFGAKA